jgi:phosphate transport system substrate-binding protein
MTQRNEAPLLIATLLFTLGLVGSGIWWANLQWGPFLSAPPAPSPSPAESPAIKQLTAVPNVPSGSFKYGGSTTWAPIREKVDSGLQLVWPDFKLQYTDPTTGTPGSGSGIRMLLNNELALAQSSRALKLEEHQKAKQQGFSLKEIPVAIDGIAIAVNPKLDLPGLTIAQLKGIYTGEITNWQQVGGPNLAIVAYSRRLADGGTVEFFADKVMDTQEFGSTVDFVRTTTEAIQKVSKTPGSIYYASAPELVGQCGVKPLPLGRQANALVPPYQGDLVPEASCPAQRNQLNAAALQTGQYPITRKLFVIVKQDGKAAQQAGEVYANLLLTEQGQELIAKAGFVRIR